MRIKSIGLYDKDSRLVEVHSTRASANRSKANYHYEKVFYYVHPEQVRSLGYAQAVDLETIIEFATIHYETEHPNKGNRIAII